MTLLHRMPLATRLALLFSLVTAVVFGIASLHLYYPFTRSCTESRPVKNMTGTGMQTHRSHREGFYAPAPARFASGEVMSRSRIVSDVWDINFDNDSNVVEVAIRRLRTKVDDPFPTKLIHTVRDMGYVLEER